MTADQKKNVWKWVGIYGVIALAVYGVIYIIWIYPYRSCTFIDKRLSDVEKRNVTFPGHYKNGVCTKDAQTPTSGTINGTRQSCPAGEEFISGQGFIGCRPIQKTEQGKGQQ